MARPVWQEKLLVKMTATPLFMVGLIVLCGKCKGDAKGKAVSLRQLVNNNWRQCERCKFSIH